MAQRFELVTQLSRLGNVHVRSLEQTPPGGTPLRIRVRQPAVDRLPHDSRDGHAALLRCGGDPSVTLVVDQDLQPMIERHAHTVA